MKRDEDLIHPILVVLVRTLPVKSGEYWIDPENSGNPFKVFCDMSTNGGTCDLVRTTVKKKC